MKNKDQSEEALIRKYINPEGIEKAPEGFTSKAVTRIQIEAETAKPLLRILKMNIVPLISLLIVFILIMVSVFVPDKETGYFGSAIWDYFTNLKISFPGINLIKFPDLPGWLIYSIMGIILTVLVDLTMGAFSNERNN